MNTPLWLQDEPDIVALLGAVLDRFDQQAGDERQRATVLRAQKYLSALDRGDERADQIWALVRELSRMGVLDVRVGRRSAYDAEWHDAKLAFAPACEAVLRAWLARPAVESQMQSWHRAVEKHAHLFPAGLDVLLARRIALPGRTADEIVAALAGLGRIERAATLRQLSAYAFWGDSKVLDERGELIATLFPHLEVRDRPIVVAAYLPERIDAALFIENHDTYVTATEGQPPASAHHALIYMAGFRGAALRIRDRGGARLHFAGPGTTRHGSEFERWWFDAAPWIERLHFWGDLDFAGMQILKSLRQRFAGVTAWQPGYEPMLARLRAAGTGSGAAGQRQVDPGSTGCDFADAQLLPAVRAHGFWDQERLAGE